MEINVEQNIRGEVRRGECNTSDVSFADIPEEIQIDILSRLPPKSLSRCQYVSKHWNDTLTIQVFLHKHSISFEKHPKLGFAIRSSIWGKNSVISFELNDYNPLETTVSPIQGRIVYFNDIPTNDYFYTSNICNELICLFRPISSCVCLLNLKTGDFIRLPAITIKSEDSSGFWYALGFDPVLKVFKVLNIYQSTSTTKAAILTVGSNYWKPIDIERLPSLVTKYLRWFGTDSLCLDGVIYCVDINRISTGSTLSVSAFDLNCEVSRQYELVRTPMRKISKYYLTSLKGRPTLLIWKKRRHEIEEVEQWTLLNHKNPNAATWNRRNFTNHNSPIIMLPFDFIGVNRAGGSTILEWSETIPSECSSYLSYNLENFALE